MHVILSIRFLSEFLQLLTLSPSFFESLFDAHISPSAINSLLPPSSSLLLIDVGTAISKDS